MAVSVAHSLAKGIKDKNIVLWFTPSDKELPHPEFPDVRPAIYNFDAMPYESVMLGFYAMWKGPENDLCGKLGIQKRNEIGMGYSRDGFHFYRPSYEPVMGVNETEGAWNWGNITNGSFEMYRTGSGIPKKNPMPRKHCITGGACPPM